MILARLIPCDEKSNSSLRASAELYPVLPCVWLLHVCVECDCLDEFVMASSVRKMHVYLLYGRECLCV